MALGGDTFVIESTDADSGLRATVRCLGFSSEQMDLGPAEIDEACAIVDKFASATSAGGEFYLVHNRDGRSRDFRELVKKRLARLVTTGRVPRAELWDRQKLLFEAFNAMLQQIASSLSGQSRSAAAAFGTEQALEVVSLHRELLEIDQYRLRSRSESATEIADPADVVLESASNNLALLIGEFGSGKTTAVLRAVEKSSLRPIYVPGALLSNRIKSTKDLLLLCFRHDGLFTERAKPVREVFELLARPVLERLLKDRSVPMTLILDGVDESAVLTRRGGFQQLFNLLAEIKIPVILTMRSELWFRERDSFEASFGPRSATQPLRKRRIQLVELLPWVESQIFLLIDRYRQRAESPERRVRLDALRALAKAGRLGEYYGDLPERPLFLNLILESVVHQGLPGRNIGRARLLRDWARHKMLRDILEPVRVGGEGRLPLAPEPTSAESSIELAWDTMLAAALQMTQRFGDTLELIGDCALEEVRAASPHLQGLAEPLGLFLNSLLLGVDQPIGTPARVRFAHRSFQEFFLAWALLTRDHGLAGASAPLSVQVWARDIIEEGLLRAEVGVDRSFGSPATSSVDPLEIASLPDLEPPYPDLILRVRLERSDGWSRFHFELESIEGKAGFRSRRFLGERLRTSPEAYRARLQSRIENLFGDSREGRLVLRSDATQLLESLGRELYDELFPARLRKAYPSFRRKVETLLVISEEPWIPWELVKPYDDSNPDEPIDDDFLCGQFQMTRWLRGARPPAVEVVPRQSACFEAGSAANPPLRHAADEYRMLERLARRHGIRHHGLPEASRPQVLESLRAGDLGLLHFVGHGHFDPKQPDDARFVLAGKGSIHPGDLRGPVQTRLKTSRPLIFFNACQLGLQSWLLTGMGGWAERCVAGCECGAFVAPQWAVTDRLSHAFAKTFYEALETGASFAEAATRARKQVRRLDGSHPTWLAYVVYAHPLGHLHLAGHNPEVSSPAVDDD